MRETEMRRRHALASTVRQRQSGVAEGPIEIGAKRHLVAGKRDFVPDVNRQYSIAPMMDGADWRGNASYRQ